MNCIYCHIPCPQFHGGSKHEVRCDKCLTGYLFTDRPNIYVVWLEYETAFINIIPADHEIIFYWNGHLIKKEHLKFVNPQSVKEFYFKMNNLKAFL